MAASAKRKKDFKLREEIVVEFERYAPRGKQTAIVEGLIKDWIEQQKQQECADAMRKAYERDSQLNEKD